MHLVLATCCNLYQPESLESDSNERWAFVLSKSEISAERDSLSAWWEPCLEAGFL